MLSSLKKQNKTSKPYFPLIMFTGPGLPRYTLHSSSNDKGIFKYFTLHLLFRKMCVDRTNMYLG